MHYRFFSPLATAPVRALAGLCILLSCVFAGHCHAGNTDYFLYGDFVHKNNIQTVLFNQTGFELSDPLIRMNSDDRLILRFDDLDADYKNYYYTIVHCNADWEPSELREFEYIEGFYEDRIRDYRRSVNTRMPYTHYWLEFPNENLRPTKSGNYILKVFLDGDRDRVVLTRRFSIFKQLVTIDGYVAQANLVRYRDRKQQLAFTINTENHRITNPYRDLKLVITQNGRWDNALTGLPPRTIQGNLLIYDHEDLTLFNGYNEFRRFDIRSLRYVSEKVEDITSSRRHWDVFLRPDKSRSHQRYVTDDDINGRFLVKTYDANNDMLEGDYAWVHFRLDKPGGPLETGHVHVVGALSDWHFTEENKMNYNYGENAYELSLLLKQGYYNYLYARVAEGNGGADVSYFEGSHSDAENDYTIYVYHRVPGDLYDKLIGIAHMNTSIPR